MLDAVVERAIANGDVTIYGYYFPTKKNIMVADFYPSLGFLPFPLQPNLPEGATVWMLDLVKYAKKNKHIKIEEHIRD